MKNVLGVTLFGVSFFVPFIRGRKQKSQDAQLAKSGEGWKLAAVGAIVGGLVAVTSVGSGSLLMIFLLLLIPLPFGKLVGTDIRRIVSAASELLLDHGAYQRMAEAVNPYGDGLASERILQALEFLAGRAPSPEPFACAVT